jgi:hypothetical protein
MTRSQIQAISTGGATEQSRRRRDREGAEYLQAWVCRQQLEAVLHVDELLLDGPVVRPKVCGGRPHQITLPVLGQLSCHSGV